MSGERQSCPAPKVAQNATGAAAHDAPGRDTLYYDGACPLCSAEVRRLQRLSGDRLAVKDIHRLDPAAVAIDTRTLLSRLHLQSADGSWVTGLEANIRAWQHTPFGWCWRILRLPLFNAIGRWAYEYWLKRRGPSY